MLRHYVLGSIKIHTIHHAAEVPIYGPAMRQELRRHGGAPGPGAPSPVSRASERPGDRIADGGRRAPLEARATSG